MISCESKQLNDLLNSNDSFKMNFGKLLLAFEERTWTNDVCVLFKALCEDLFFSYKINVKVHVRSGKFEIEFLDHPEEEEKSVDRSTLDVVKWLVKK